MLYVSVFNVDILLVICTTSTGSGAQNPGLIDNVNRTEDGPIAIRTQLRFYCGFPPD